MMQGGFGHCCMCLYDLFKFVDASLGRTLLYLTCNATPPHPNPHLHPTPRSNMRGYIFSSLFTEEGVNKRASHNHFELLGPKRALRTFS